MKLTLFPMLLQDGNQETRLHAKELVTLLLDSVSDLGCSALVFMVDRQQRGDVYTQREDMEHAFDCKRIAHRTCSSVKMIESTIYVRQPSEEFSWSYVS